MSAQRLRRFLLVSEYTKRRGKKTGKSVVRERWSFSFFFEREDWPGHGRGQQKKIVEAHCLKIPEKIGCKLYGTESPDRLESLCLIN